MKEERLGAVSRRLQVLSSCLHYIFDLKLSDARKQESKEDEHGIAYAMLYLSNIYCRNEQFWEAAFFHDVHRQLRRLYMPIKEDLDCPFSVQENATDTWNLMEEPSGMDLVFDDETVVSESESDVESGFIESDDGDLGNATVKWIRRLIDRICSAAGLEHAQIERLCDEIPGFVALHIDNLEQVYTESKRLSPMHKPKLLQPALLLPSEHVLLGGMRVFLLNDGRSLGNVCGDSPQSLLPAEGAIFLTNYRLVFKGQPCDPFR
uniref:GRAM domain-containing protein n=1 Tax=Parascaris equorum TaxID=6256 RepID=A0A914RXR1_PAREQ